MDNTDYIKKAFEFKSQKRFKQAIDMLYKALVNDENNLEILTELACVYFELPNFERASYYAEKVLEQDLQNEQCLLLLKNIHLKNGEFAKAKQIMDKIVEGNLTEQNIIEKIILSQKINDIEAIDNIYNQKNELTASALFELSKVFSDDKQKEKELLELASKQDNSNEKVLLNLAKIYYSEKDFEKAKKLFSDISDKNSEVLNYLGLFEIEKFNYAKAIDYFSKACKCEMNSEYLYNLGETYLLSGWLDEAEKTFLQALKFDNKNLKLKYTLAYVYYQKNELTKALGEIKDILKSNKTHKEANILNALISIKNGELLNAKDELEKFADNDFTFFELSKINKELKIYDKAEQNIQKALELKPKNMNYLLLSAEIQIDKKEFKKAKEMLENILKINNKYIPAYEYLAQITYENNEFDECYDIAQALIELDENSAKGYYYNALALFKNSDTAFAIESLKKAISLDLNNALLYAKMSEFYQDLGKFEYALNWAKEASYVDDKNYKYKWLAATCARVLKDNENAIKYYSQSYRLQPLDIDLIIEYTTYLNSIGKQKQAKAILKSSLSKINDKKLQEKLNDKYL